MKVQVRLILSTLALTVLIWTYADRASHGFITLIVPVTLAPAEPGSRLVLRVAGAREDGPNVSQIKMTLRGPKREIGLLKSEHDYGGFGLVVKIAEDLRPGRHRRNLFADLSDSPEILERGLTLESISPKVVEFDVDRYTTIPVELVQATGRFENDLDGEPILSPEKVTARVLESKLSEGVSLSPLPLALEEAISEALDKQPEVTEGPLTLTFEVPVRSSRPGVEATFEPDRVQVAVKLKGDSKEVRITVRPLGVMIKTQDFFEGYEIEWDPEQRGAQFTQIINVRVPISKLSRLGELESHTDAYVVIDDSDLPQDPTGVASTMPTATESKTYSPWPVHFKFPPGFEDVKLEGPDPTVKLRVVRKKTGPAEPPTP